MILLPDRRFSSHAWCLRRAGSQRYGYLYTDISSLDPEPEYCIELEHDGGDRDDFSSLFSIDAKPFWFDRAVATGR